MDILDAILKLFFMHQLQLKMLHFQTKKYSVHKSIDTYLNTFADKFDKFMEVAQGIWGKISTRDMNITFNVLTDENVIKEIEDFIIILKKLDKYKENFPELSNIKDELVGDAQKLKYLLTFY